MTNNWFTNIRTAILFGLFALSYLPDYAVAQGAADSSLIFKEYKLEFSGSFQEAFLADYNADGLTDIIIVHHDNEKKILSFYMQLNDGSFSFEPAQIISLPRNTTGISFADVLNGKELDVIVYTESQINCIPYNSETGLYDAGAKELLKRDSFFWTAQIDYIPLLYPVLDINSDGIHDIVLPNKNGYELIIPEEKGNFERSFMLELPSTNFATTGRKMRRDVGFSFRSILPKLFITDFNEDGLLDLVYLHGNVLFFHLQQKQTGFTDAPDGRLTLPLEADALSSNKIGDVSYQLFDIDGNGVQDIVITMTTGDTDSFQNINTKIFIFLANKDMSYRKTPTHIIKIKGVVILPQFTDINKDGKLDMVLAVVETDIGSKLTEALLKHFTVRYEVFLFKAKANNYPEVSDYSINLNIPTSNVQNKATDFSFVNFNCDFDGDGINDILIYNGTEKNNIEIKQGSSGRGASSINFSRTPVFSETIKDFPDELKFADINRDGRSDIIFTYGGKRCYVWISQLKN